MSDAAWLVLAILILTLCAWVKWRTMRPPRCPHCFCLTEPLRSEIMSGSPLVLRIGFRCPRCEDIVAHRAVATRD